MSMAIETELGSAIGAAALTAYPTASVRVFTCDDEAAAVDEEAAYPFVGVLPSPAVAVETGDVLFTCRVRVLVGTHYVTDRKATDLAALWQAVRDALADETTLDEAIAANIRLLGLYPTDSDEPYRSLRPGDVPGFPNLQGYELDLTAAIAATDSVTTTTTTTTTTAP